MTHSQAHHGQVACNGRLEYHDSFPDHHLTHSGPVRLVVTIYRCRTCSHRLTVERIAHDRDQVVELEPRVTSDCIPIGPRQMVKALAGRLALDGRLPLAEWAD